MEETALHMLISLQSVWLIVTNKVQLTTILKLSGCIKKDLLEIKKHDANLNLQHS